MTQGWYRDPGGGPLDRWWDGSQWTVHTQPAGFAAYQQQLARSSRATGALARLVLWTLGLCAAGVLLVCFALLVTAASA